MAELLSFALHTFAPIAISIFLAGYIYKIVKLIGFPGSPKDYSEARGGIGSKIIGLIYAFYCAIVKYGRKDIIRTLSGLIFFHFPLLLIIFLYPPHMSAWIDFFGFLIPPIRDILASLSTVFYIPSTPVLLQSSEYILNADLLTFIAIFGLIILLIHETEGMLSKSLKFSLADYLAGFAMLAIFIFGYAAVHRLMDYELALGIHILLAFAVLAYLPFSKFVHFTIHYWVNKVLEGARIGKRGLLK